MITRIAVSLLILATPLLSAASSNYIYALRKDNSVVYIFGGIRSYPDASATLSDCVVRTAKTSHKIYVETDPYIGLIEERNLKLDIKAKEVIERLSESARSRLKQLAGDQYATLLDQDALFLATVTKKVVPGFYQYARTLKDQLGFDYQVYVLAKENSLELGEIESATTKSHAYQSVPLETWAQVVEYYLGVPDSSIDTSDFVSRMKSENEASLRGDEDSLLRSSTYSIPPLSEFHRIAVLDRNENMAKAIDARTKESHGLPVFVALRAIRLPGAAGIISRLTSMGYSAKRICVD